jgi:thiol-disulfide isomerase/thioredoxin
MKKYFPIILFILGFIGFLITQIGIQKTKKLNEFSRAPSSGSKKFEVNFKNLSLTSIDNKKYILANLDIPIIILNFWAPWCGPCIEELPSLLALRKKYSNQEVLILGISSDADDSVDGLKKLIEEYKLDFPIVLDSSGDIFNLFDISSIPSSLIFYKGKVIEINKGPKDFDSIEFIETLDKLLNKSLALTGQI